MRPGSAAQGAILVGDHGQAGDVAVGQLHRPGVQPPGPGRVSCSCGRHASCCSRTALLTVTGTVILRQCRQQPRQALLTAAGGVR